MPGLFLIPSCPPCAAEHPSSRRGKELLPPRVPALPEGCGLFPGSSPSPRHGSLSLLLSHGLCRHSLSPRCLAQGWGRECCWKGRGKGEGWVRGSAAWESFRQPALIGAAVPGNSVSEAGRALSGEGAAAGPGRLPWDSTAAGSDGGGGCTQEPRLSLIKKASRFSQPVLTELSTFLPARKGKASRFHHAELCQQRHP